MIEWLILTTISFNNIFLFLLSTFFILIIFNNFIWSFQINIISFIDYITLFLVFLSILIIVFIVSLILSKQIINFVQLALLCILLFFFSSSLVILFFFFELTLCPILILMIGWGYQFERLQASRYLLIYTILCSLPIIYFVILFFSQAKRLFIRVRYFSITFLLKTVLLFVFFVKLPIFGLHLWLPKAHVEAPTIGSILLAGILLKLGSYGLIRILVLFKNYKNILLYFIIPIGVILSCIFCIFQTDAKRLVAYSSVSHINFLLLVVLFYFLKNKVTRIIIIFRHGIISRLIFFIVGWFYQIIFSRKLYFLQIINKTNIRVLFVLLLIIIANFGAPPFIRRIIEIVFVTSSFIKNNLFCIFIIFLIILSAYSSLYLLLRVIFGKNIYINFNSTNIIIIFFSFLIIYFIIFIIILNFWIFSLLKIFNLQLKEFDPA